jgi:hypothetical protein
VNALTDTYRPARLWNRPSLGMVHSSIHRSPPFLPYEFKGLPCLDLYFLTSQFYSGLLCHDPICLKISLSNWYLKHIVGKLVGSPAPSSLPYCAWPTVTRTQLQIFRPNKNVVLFVIMIKPLQWS